MQLFFMEISCYIIYSRRLDRYYIGYTVDFEERLWQHNSGYYGSGAYTSKAGDWEEYLVIPCETIGVKFNFFLPLMLKLLWESDENYCYCCRG